MLSSKINHSLDSVVTLSCSHTATGWLQQILFCLVRSNNGKRRGTGSGQCMQLCFSGVE